MAAEQRLISASATVEAFTRWLTSRYDGRMPCDIVAKIPTVDARPVVHGEWSTIEDDYCGLIALECSECKAQWWFEDSASFDKYHYCPNCGAQMDGG